MDIPPFKVIMVVETLQYIRLAYRQQYYSQHPATGTSSTIQQSSNSAIQQFSTMSYRTSITDSGSENEQFDEFPGLKNKPTTSKTKNGLKRGVDKIVIEKKMNKKKPMKLNTSYREGVCNLLKSEDYESEVENSITFRQGDGIVTIKCPFEEKPTEYWTLVHYKSSNIEHVPVKDRWKHSEATVKLYTSEKTKDQALHSSLNQVMQTIFDTMLRDPSRRTIKNKTTV